MPIYQPYLRFVLQYAGMKFRTEGRSSPGGQIFVVQKAALQCVD